MAAKFLCGYCQAVSVPTRKGLRSHVTQNPFCRAARARQAQLNIAAGNVLPPEPALVPGEDVNTDPHVEVDDTYADIPTPPPSSAARDAQSNPHRVTVEEVEDIEPGGLPRRPWLGEYPDPTVGNVLRQAKTFFEDIHERKSVTGQSNFAPFANREEWELARFLMRSGLSQEAIQDYLTLPIVCQCSVLRSDVGTTYSTI